MTSMSITKYDGMWSLGIINNYLNRSFVITCISSGCMTAITIPL